MYMFNVQHASFQVFWKNKSWGNFFRSLTHSKLTTVWDYHQPEGGPGVSYQLYMEAWGPHKYLINGRQKIGNWGDFTL